jgi:hypothetical protein
MIICGYIRCIGIGSKATTSSPEKPHFYESDTPGDNGLKNASAHTIGKEKAESGISGSYKVRPAEEHR